MPQQLTTAVQNNFSKGLITEATGLNFPENACTDADNCIFSLLGDVLRREGIDYEVNGTRYGITKGLQAISTYKWNNAGGDGETQIVVLQVGGTLYFFESSAATASAPLSTQVTGNTVGINSFLASGATYNISQECQFADGNGYLFVYHPNCDPFYVTLTAGVATGNRITLQIRDFVGIIEPGVSPTTRPGSLTSSHLYNLMNQGWNNTGTWQANSSSIIPYSSLVANANVTNSFTTSAGLPIVAGTPVFMQATIGDASGSVFLPSITGIVISYSGTALVINTNAFPYPSDGPTSPTFENWAITPLNQGGQIGTWVGAIGNYPSNSDVWWNYKDDTGVFNPTATFAGVSDISPAPQGHFVFSPFNQNYNALFGGSGLTTISTTVRPRTGTWFQGRIWYAGVDAQQAAAGTAPYYTWSENIYFSQIVQTPTDFGQCYQVNDPTSETLFDLLPTDGGVIQIQGCGAVYKLFPIQNGMLVFAANGVWFITGSQGIGFSANDYTITKLSNVRSISSYSFVNVNGLPYFWNEEGIYAVTPTQGGALSVDPITVGTILTFYNSIPLDSKIYARADYDPINYIIQWVFKSVQETGPGDRYIYDSALTFNTYNKAFYPYTVATVPSAISGIIYVSSPGGTDAPDAVLKYVCSDSQFIGFGDEHDPTYVDWLSTAAPQNYTSNFTTGYIIRGQAIHKSQPQYIQVYCNSNGAASAYKIQGIWDYANDPNSGRWSSIQLVTNGLTRNNIIYRRHKIRGHGYVLQFQITSADGMPFDIIGWSTVDTTNQGT